ncbi:sensor domain-containing diguanylate cyclase [Salinisphaera sp. LB1]|uniref:GGDEF domain-containing protein n=1 Tax=Salinisphaera sp. LB1 TaxID=2183911 RepID=UPI000D705FF2|nr:sensor domain-containing diguanylate cyclase [Salinisphaera sp. LB1]AWN16208.1 diguanylate cyclase/phosphodiesterase (GGDEF & EAL domains) with PAS/PAC sensor(s) [Salinisphaera sp. LB1]
MADEDDLLSFMYACPFGLIELDERGDIGLINPHAMMHLLPLAGAQGVENFFAAMEKFAPELRNFADGFAEPHGTICDGHRVVVDLGQKSRDGRPTVLACSLVKRGPNQLIATLSDISEQVTQEQRMRQADTWFSALIDEVNDHALLTVAGDGTVLSANPSFVRQTGYAAEQVVGQCVDTFLSETDDEAQIPFSIADQLALASRDGWHLFEGWEKRANGERYWCQRLLVARAEQDDDDAPTFSMVLRDVPEPAKKTNDLIELLTRDYLTGAVNRMQFQKVLKLEHTRCLTRRRPLSLIILDLDDFKSLNDMHGHPAGDTALKQVAQIGADCTPARAVFARLSGEEFALLAPEYPLSAAIELAETLRRKIAERQIAVPRGQVNVTASLGCSEMRETDGSTDDLIAIADRRLYEAKNAGRNRVAPAPA